MRHQFNENSGATFLDFKITNNKLFKILLGRQKHDSFNMRSFCFHVNKYYKNTRNVKLDKMSTRNVNGLFMRTNVKVIFKGIHRERTTRERRDLPV